jgi:glycosyltransferase involved in cell wall biosynthesis
LRDDFYGAQRFVSWERHGNKPDPLVAEKTLCLTSPLLPAPILRKARDNRFHVWQFPWHGGAVVVYWGPFKNLDTELVYKAAKHFDKWDFVFVSPSGLDEEKIPGSLKTGNIHVLGAKDAEHIYPLLSSTSCIWIPVLPTGSSDLSGHYETALAAGLPFVLPRNSVHRHDAPYSYCFDSVDEAIEQLARAIETEIDLAVVDAYMKKYSPTGVADYIMAAANNELFIEQDCGKESFGADLPKPMQLPENRPCIALEINSMDRGGMEEVVCNLATQFDHLHAKPVIVCVEKRGLLAESAVQSGVRLEIMYNDIDSYEHFLREQSVALINTHYSDFGSGIASRLGIPVVSTIHNSYVWFDKEYRKRFKSADPGITHYIAVSNNVSQYMVERLEISQEKISVIPNGVDAVRLSFLERTPPRITRDTFGLDAHDFVFLNVASLDGRKNHHAIISAVKRLISDYPNIRVICAGNIMEPVYYKVVKERVERLGLSDRILFPGYIQEVVDLYRLSDAFLLPSIVEGWSIAMTEALFFGLPLILTDVGGAKEVLEKPGIGLLVSNSFGEITSLTDENLGTYTREESPSNLEELIRAMEDVLTRPEYWQDFSKKRRQLVKERYSLEIAVNKTMDVFRRFL